MNSISPLRYPGGKSRIYEKVYPLLKENKADSYAEPFSGGFGIGLLLLKNKIVKNVYINDLDINIFSFWQTVIKDYSFMEKHIKRVSKFESYEQWLDERKEQIKIWKSNRYGFRKKGFATLFLNRVNRSGILSAGPIGGKKQNGNYKINCRFNPQKLLEQISWIYSQRSNIAVSNKNYDVFMKSLDKKTFIFLDPPYVVKGGKLYMNNFRNDDHIKLKDFIKKIKSPWILTYDNTNLIRQIYDNKIFTIKEFDLNHFAGTFKIGKELFISRKF